jgi:hypothetical protein
MTPEQRLALAEDQDAEALEFELEAEKAVTGAYVAAAATAVAGMLAAGAALQAGQIGVSVLRDILHRLIGTQRARPPMAPALTVWVFDGITLGRAQGFQAAGKKWRPLDGASIPDPDLRSAPADMDRTTQAILDEADRLADDLDLAEESNVLTVASKVTSSGKQAEGATRWAANRAINAGISDAARRMGMDLLWAAERNACLKCLAYSGLTVKPGEVFPVGLTLGTGKSTLGGIPYPPLHRYCRCRVRPYAGPDATQKGTDEASGLQREANRTVARGWSDYASQPERLRAVDLLLKRGFMLPKTVLARAERDLRRGTFSQRQRPRTTLSA